MLAWCDNSQVMFMDLLQTLGVLLVAIFGLCFIIGASLIQFFKTGKPMWLVSAFSCAATLVVVLKITFDCVRSLRRMLRWR